MKMRRKLSRALSNRKFKKGARVDKKNIPRNSRGGTRL